MNILLKILKWIGVSFAVILVVVLGFTFIMYQLGSGTMEEVEEFTKEGTKDDCLFEVAKRMKDCTELNAMNCMLPATTFGAGCFEMAPGDSNLYCDGKRMRELPKDYCRDYPKSTHCNQIVVGVVSGFCAGDT